MRIEYYRYVPNMKSIKKLDDGKSQISYNIVSCSEDNSINEDWAKEVKGCYNKESVKKGYSYIMYTVARHRIINFLKHNYGYAILHTQATKPNKGTCKTVVHNKDSLVRLFALDKIELIKTKYQKEKYYR